MKQIITGFGFFSGITYPFRTLLLFIRQPKLLSYIIVPILVNCVIGGLLYAGFLWFGWQMTEVWILNATNGVDSLIANLPPWLRVLDEVVFVLLWLVRLLISLAVLVITGFILAQFGTLLGSPWYGQLSEKLEKWRTGTVTTIEVGIVRDIGRAILFELRKLVLAIGIGVILFLFNFLPGIGTLIATVGGIILTATLVCLDFFDAPLERRRITFQEKLGVIRRTLPASAGFSLVCLLLISVPLLNLVTIPLCVAAGTLFICDRFLSDKNARNR